jgi:hypothetical protein
MHIANISLSYSGLLADRSEIDFYDVSQALVGFQLSLALTTHLILNDKIIVQAPSLKGAQILAFPTERGSWKFAAAIVTAGTIAYQLGTAPRDTPLGHLVSSAYDYWPAPGSEDTELVVLMEREVGHGEAEVYTRVQA